MKTDNKSCPTTIGGQAVYEGIMMKGPSKTSIVVRKGDGSLERKIAPLKSSKNPLSKIPFFRGIIIFIDMLKLGIDAIDFSSKFMEFEGEESKFDKWIMEKFGAEKSEKIIFSFALFLGILFPVLLFIIAPTLLTGLTSAWVSSATVKNIIESVLRIGIFVGFMYLISLQSDMKRVFSYHGAEHKTIFCYEHRDELTVENVKKFSRFHPRCGTSFLLVVMIISIIVFSFFSWSNPIMRVVVRLLMLPVIVGISYEINRYVGRNDNAFTKALRAPGLWMQRLTTVEPDDSMIEVAISALNDVIPSEGEDDKW